MRCIYFGKDKVCYAEPSTPLPGAKYKPEREVREKYCQATDFRNCQRFVAILEYLRACKGE